MSWGALVCVNDQNYALVIVIKLETKGYAIRSDRKTQFSFLIQPYKTILV